MSKSPIILLNGEPVKESEARISPVNRGLMYGDGCFDTLKSYSGQFLGWQEHFERLTGSLEYLGMKPTFSSSGLKDDVLQLLEMNGLSQTEAMIRIQCWREGDRGYTTSSSQMNWMIQVKEVHEIEEPFKLWIAETRCIPSQALERKFKLSNGLNYIKAGREALANSADDALMLTIENFVSETTSANIFWIYSDTIFTPSDECDLLPGTTRNLIKQMLRENRIFLETGKFSVDHLLHAEAAFCSNSINEIQPIERINKNAFDTAHPLLKKVMILFEKFKQQMLNA